MEKSCGSSPRANIFTLPGTRKRKYPQWYETKAQRTAEVITYNVEGAQLFTLLHVVERFRFFVILTTVSDARSTCLALQHS